MNEDKIKLTDKNVETILISCLFGKNEDTNNAIKVEGIVNNFGFNPDELKNHEEEIYLWWWLVISGLHQRMEQCLISYISRILY